MMKLTLTAAMATAVMGKDQARLRGRNAKIDRNLDTVEYYSIPSTGLCAPRSTAPSWITGPFFTSYAECCSVGWVETKCLAEAPPGAIQNTETKIQYYVNSSNGLCVEKDVYAPAYLRVEDFYDTMRECCEKSWNVEECMADIGPMEPTKSPSLRPSYGPSVSMVPTEEPSVVATDSPSASPSVTVGTDAPSASPSVTAVANTTEPTVSMAPSASPSVIVGVNTTEPTVSSNDTSTTAPSTSPSPSVEVNTTEPTISPTILTTNSAIALNDTNVTDTTSTVTPTTTIADSNSTDSTETATTSTATTSEASNSTCVAAKWHVSDDFTKCSNNFDYPPVWDTPGLSTTYLKDNLDDCCAQFFWIHGNACESEDICAEGSDGDDDMLCEENKWHPDEVNMDGCSNSEEFPDEWRNNFLFDNVTACCAKFFGEGDCVVYNVCEQNTSSTEAPVLTTVVPQTTEVSNGTTVAPENVTMDATEATVSPGMSENVTTVAPETTETTSGDTNATTEATTSPNATTAAPETTDTQVTTTESTEITPVTTTQDPETTVSATTTEASNSECVSAQWHISPDFSKCTNSPDYPTQWNAPSMKDTYLHNTSIACCNEFFAGVDCVMEDVCPCEVAMWHISNDFSRCTNNPDYPPEWDTQPLQGIYLYPTINGCCDEFFGGDLDTCSPEDVCAMSATTTEVPVSVTDPTEETSSVDPETTAAVTTEASDATTVTTTPEVTDVTTTEATGVYNTTTVEPVTTEISSNVTTQLPETTVPPGTTVSAETTQASTGSTTTPNATTPPPQTTVAPGTTTASQTTPNSLQLLPCTSNQWHPDVIHADGCSNSLDYPDDWKNVSELFFDSADECCTFFRPDQECQVYRACEEGEPLSTGPLNCTSNVWFPDMANKDGCTNNPDIPDQFRGMAHILFGSSESCCSTLLSGSECNVYKICEEDTFYCSNDKWHPDMKTEAGCSNSVDVPEEWEPKYFFNSSAACCDFFFPDGGCIVNQICEDTSLSSIQ